MDIQFMKKALQYAKKCKVDVPVGAVIVKNGKVVGYGYNQKEVKQDATCHAEILAIQKASKKLKNFILEDCEMYVTLEPCMMCYGAISGARIAKVYFGAYNHKYPIVATVDHVASNHHTHYEGGILEEESTKLIQEFFKKLREKHDCDKNKDKT